MKLSSVIDELVEERGLDKATLSSIVCEGMLAAYTKKYPDLEIQVIHDKKTDSIVVTSKKIVTSSVTDSDTQISTRKALFVDKSAKEGDELWLPFEKGIGRIEILRAKQVIASKMRDIEALAVYDQFKDKEGTVVYGVVHKCERNGTSIKLQDDILAFLPKSLSIPGENFTVGFTVKALLKEVLPQPKHETQLILDRSSADFLQKLFELEVPEVFEKLVTIKNIVRKAGYKSKVMVSSNDDNIDPIGTCVGVGGARIKPILKELGNERIDVIGWSNSIENRIKDSLKPAEIDRVELMDDSNAQVWLDSDQRSLAIGKLGQNIKLASELVGVNIHLAQGEQVSVEQDLSENIDL